METPHSLASDSVMCVCGDVHWVCVGGWEEMEMEMEMEMEDVHTQYQIPPVTALRASQRERERGGKLDLQPELSTSFLPLLRLAIEKIAKIVVASAVKKYASRWMQGLKDAENLVRTLLVSFVSDYLR